MRKYYCVIVLYNKKLADSVTLNGLLPIQSEYNLTIYVVDNSTRDDCMKYNEKNYFKYQIQYLSMRGNVGLSKAYNNFLNKLFEAKYDDNDLIVWLDDDTLVGEEYFNALNAAQSISREVSIFVPTIEGQDGVIWSPNEAGFLKNHLIHDKKYVISNNRFNAINSCTAVRIYVYKNYRYDERLFIDEVDHKFFSDQRAINRKFLRINTTVVQNFSQRSQVLDPKILYNRLIIRFRDIIMYGKIKGGIYKFLAILKCCGLSANLSIRLKSIKFFLKSFRLGFTYFFNGG